MKILVFAAVTLAAGTVAADVSIIDNNKTITVDCTKDKSVNLIGNQLTVKLTGTCTRVQLSGNHETVTGSATTFWVAGNHNTVTADGTDEIQIAGNDNTLSWKKGLTKPAPTVSNPGKGNKVTQAK